MNEVKIKGKKKQTLLFEEFLVLLPLFELFGLIFEFLLDVRINAFGTSTKFQVNYLVKIIESSPRLLVAQVK